jgi:hypothetical protein
MMGINTVLLAGSGRTYTRSGLIYLARGAGLHPHFLAIYSRIYFCIQLSEYLYIKNKYYGLDDLKKRRKYAKQQLMKIDPPIPILKEY